MHSVEELGTNVPAFLAKLWKMVEDIETNDLICWSPNGASFFIKDQARFARELLPLYYKHNNMASFVRQLNMYGFHKVVSIESGGLKIDRDDMEFAHQCFLMGHPYLLEHIKRKIPSNKSDDGRAGTKPEFVNKVLSEVKSLKGRQDDVDSQLSAMKRENEVLWREVALLRQKHLKQQQIVNKLIQFLVSMVQTSRGSGIGIKRHYPLMINDIAHRSNKPSKINGNITDVNSLPSNNSSPTGPVIHELDPAELLDGCSPVDDVASPVFDLCNTVDTATSSHIATSTPGSAATLANILPEAVEGSVLEGHPTEVLLELAEECPDNSDVGLEMTGNSHLCTGVVKQNKGKQKSSVFKGSKRRKSKPSLKTPSHLVTVKTEKIHPDNSVNVNNFLEIMLPSLVEDTDDTERLEETRLSDPVGEVIVPDMGIGSIGGDQQSSLEAATDAAISAINNVAAQATSAASSSKTSPGDGTLNLALNTNVAGQKTVPETDTENTVSSKDLTLACASSGDAYKYREDFDAHLDSMQTELDSLKELLKGEGYNLDANMLLGLFGEDSLSYGIPIFQDGSLGKEEKSNIASDPTASGSELMAYSSNLFDLADMSGLDDWDSSAGSGGLTGDQSSDLHTPLVAVNSPGFSGAAGKKKKK